MEFSSPHKAKVKLNQMLLGEKEMMGGGILGLFPNSNEACLLYFRKLDGETLGPVNMLSVTYLAGLS